MDTWVWIVIVAAVVIGAVVALLMIQSRRRTRLQERFGREYDRTVNASDSRRSAEQELRDRVSRRDEIELRPLSDASRDRYEHEWAALQARFVDRPEGATTDADQLITELMSERGYPVDDFESKSSLVSVDHPDVVENYRTAHGISRLSIEGRANTEDLRRAVVAYRSLFEVMLRDDANV
jgi:hypothetical protein